MLRIPAWTRGGIWTSALKCLLVLFIANSVDAQATAPVDIKGSLTSMQSIGGKVWIRTNNGDYWWDGTLHPLHGVQVVIDPIQSIDGNFWLGTPNGAYWWDGTLHPVPGVTDFVNSIQSIDGKVWITTTWN